MYVKLLFLRYLFVLFFVVTSGPFGEENSEKKKQIAFEEKKNIKKKYYHFSFSISLYLVQFFCENAKKKDNKIHSEISQKVIY